MESRKKRSQCIVRHFYREVGFSLRRGVVVLQRSAGEILSEAALSPQGTASAVLCAFAAQQTQYHSQRWEAVGYIYAERSASGVLARGPTEFDAFGLPTDHMRFPVVVRVGKHWILPCSWGDRCRCHHLLFDVAGCLEEQSNKKRKRRTRTAQSAATERALEDDDDEDDDGDAAAAPFHFISWEDIARAEAMRRWGCGDPFSAVVDLEEILNASLPPDDPTGKPLRELWPEGSATRRVWMAAADSVDGICLLLPEDRLIAGSSTVFLALVKKSGDGDRPWALTNEFVCVPIVPAGTAPLLPAPVQQQQQHQQHRQEDEEEHASHSQGQAISVAAMALSDLMAADTQSLGMTAGPHALSELFVPPMSAMVSAYIVVPSQMSLLESALLQTPVPELSVCRCSRQRVIRITLRARGSGGPLLPAGTVLGIEDCVAIDFTSSTVSLTLPNFVGADAVVECVTHPSTPEWGSTQKQQNPLLFSFFCRGRDGIQQQPFRLLQPFVSVRYCRCSFLVPEMPVTVQCGPSFATLNNLATQQQQQQSLVS